MTAQDPSPTESPLSEPDAYWERAGELGYADAMYASPRVARHLIGRTARLTLEVAEAIGIGERSRVLELGCGDGHFANTHLAPRCARVRGVDKSEAAVERAARHSGHAHVDFEAADITRIELEPGAWDAAFLLSILHHVKPGTPGLVERLARAEVPRVVVWEPNGNHIGRRLLELSPAYRRAGEDSFRASELLEIFGDRGYRPRVRRRVNLFPNFTPGFVFDWLRPLEEPIERSALLNALCTVNLFGFVLD